MIEGEIHIQPGPTPTLRRWLEACPFCGRAGWIVGATQWYYSTTWTCCRCGDAWADGEMLPRPFRPGWRVEAVRRAQWKWWEALLA